MRLIGEVCQRICSHRDWNGDTSHRALSLALFIVEIKYYIASHNITLVYLFLLTGKYVKIGQASSEER
jgi:hypothetical protein